MNNQNVLVERFFRVSSIEYRVSCILSIEYQVPTRYMIHDAFEYRVSSVNLHLVGTVHVHGKNNGNQSKTTKM